MCYINFYIDIIIIYGNVIERLFEVFDWFIFDILNIVRVFLLIFFRNLLTLESFLFLVFDVIVILLEFIDLFFEFDDDFDDDEDDMKISFDSSFNRSLKVAFRDCVFFFRVVVNFLDRDRLWVLIFVVEVFF